MKRVRLYALLPVLLLISLLYSNKPIVAETRSGETQIVLEDAVPTRLLSTLRPGIDWFSWYQAVSGYEANTAHFGTYALEVANDDLYIGFGSAMPAAADGGMVVHYDGLEMNVVASANSTSPYEEQGIHQLLWDGSTLHVAGTDPCCGDDWSLGNHYTYDADLDLFTKYRSASGLEDVVHVWGLWDDGDRLFMAASGVNSPTCTFTAEAGRGMIFESYDNGETWQHITDLGCYRAYTIGRYNHKLFASYQDSSPQIKIAKSLDDGSSWQDIDLPQGVAPFGLIEFQGNLLAVSQNYRSLYMIKTANDQLQQIYNLPPGFSAGTYHEGAQYLFHDTMTVVDGRLYALWTSSAGEFHLVYTDDLANWHTLVRTTEPLIALTFWPNRGWLVAGSVGIESDLYYLDPSSPTNVTWRTHSANASSSDMTIYIISAALLAASTSFLYSRLKYNRRKSSCA